MLATALTGCVQSTATGTRSAPPAPETAAVATGEPVVLSGAAYTEGNLPTPPSPKANPPATLATADVVPAPTGTTPGAVETVPLAPSPPLFAAPTIPTPPETLPTPTPAWTPPAETNVGAADPPPVPATTADGFPNINVPPRQPGGQLLTPEERAKLIAELNALAGRKPSGAQ